MSDEPEEQWDDAYAVCPYCKHQNHVEAESYSEHERAEKCDECERTFMQMEIFTITHRTKPIVLSPKEAEEKK